MHTMSAIRATFCYSNTIPFYSIKSGMCKGVILSGMIILSGMCNFIPDKICLLKSEKKKKVANESHTIGKKCGP